MDNEFCAICSKPGNFINCCTNAECKNVYHVDCILKKFPDGKFTCEECNKVLHLQIETDYYNCFVSYFQIICYVFMLIIGFVSPALTAFGNNLFIGFQDRKGTDVLAVIPSFFLGFIPFQTPFHDCCSYNIFWCDKSTKNKRRNSLLTMAVLILLINIFVMVSHLVGYIYLNLINKYESNMFFTGHTSLVGLLISYALLFVSFVIFCAGFVLYKNIHPYVMKNSIKINMSVPLEVSAELVDIPDQIPFEKNLS